MRIREGEVKERVRVGVREVRGERQFESGLGTVRARTR